MELDELQNNWTQYDKKIAENIKLNKTILKRILAEKPEKRLNLIKIKAISNVLSPVILLLLVVIMKMKFTISTHFYIGLGLFAAGYITAYILDVKYLMLIRRIDLSNAILSIQKEIAGLEKYRIKSTQIRYSIMPLSIVGVLMMIIQKPFFNSQSIIVLVLIVLVFILSIYFTFRYSIHEQFRKLNKEISEIVELEKE